jgi:hypothetical protein
MRVRTVLALAGTTAAAVVGAGGSALASTNGPTVSVKIKTPSKTLLNKTGVHGGHGWITKGGTPSGKCPAASAAGALNTATHGNWTGKYYSSVGGIFITSILGYKPSGHSYWEVIVNGRASDKGICDIKLKQGERLLFKVA